MPDEPLLPYSIVVDEERRVVRCVVSGAFTAAIAPQLSREARGAALERGFNLLYDIRAARAMELRKADVFWMPRNFEALKSPEVRRMRAAVLHLPQHREIVEFWETVYRNMGLPASGFEDESLALRWLAGTP